MQKLLSLTFLLGLTSALAAPTGEKGTAGLTPGEPGQGDHGHGMKGLGGGMVEVLCVPRQVALGQPFIVNVHYLNDIKRPVDIHVDVLSAKTKAVFGSSTARMETQEGFVSAQLKMDWGEEPFLWKVFTTPRGEPFPNMIAETGMVIALGRSVEGNCQRFENYGSDLNPNRNVDYVLLQDYPKNIAPGQTIPVTVTYNLASEAAGSLAVSVMYKGPNTLVSGGGVDAKAGKNTVTVLVTVPGDVRMEPVYIIATLLPTGKGWEERLSEDRTYSVNLGRRMLREEIAIPPANAFN